jgi:DNA polymerase-3 subunit delta
MPATDKKGKEFGNSMEFMDSYTDPKNLPRILCFVSQDTFEFELILDFYRDKLIELGESGEKLVFTGESGDLEQFFSHAFTPDMFFPNKVLIIKSGVSFFKPLISGSAKKPNDLYRNFLHQIPQLSDSVRIIIHYETWEIPTSIKKLFAPDLVTITSKNFYPNETKKNLENLLRKYDLELSESAQDEFLHRMNPSMGSYAKNLLKLKSYLNKKKFELEDIQDVLLGKTGVNYQVLVSFLFQNRRAEFFKEYSKITDLRAELGILMNRILARLNEIRIFRSFQKRFKGNLPEDKLFESLGMQSYSEKRRYHVIRELGSESKYFKDKTLETFYQALVDMNLRHKTQSDLSLDFYIQKKLYSLFTLFDSH